MQAAFFTRINGKLTAFPFDEILFITAKNNYSEIVTTKKKFFVYLTLGWFEEHLPQNLFCRVHRSHIIAVQKISAFDHREVEIGGVTIPINKPGFESILERVLVFSNDRDDQIKKQIEEVLNARSFERTKNNVSIKNSRS